MWGGEGSGRGQASELVKIVLHHTVFEGGGVILPASPTDQTIKMKYHIGLHRGQALS